MGISEHQRESGRVQRHDEIRRRLLQAVDRLPLSGESYATVSIERLASAANLSRATFYSYFDGKADLLRAGFTEMLAELATASGSWLALDGTASEGELQAALHPIIDTYRRHATLAAAITDEATQDSSLRDQLDTAIDRAIAALQEQIARGQREGWADAELLSRETAAWLVWLLERGLGELASTATDDQMRALSDTLATMTWRIIFA